MIKKINITNLEPGIVDQIHLTILCFETQQNTIQGDSLTLIFLIYTTFFGQKSLKNLK
jgi:hypothetical protein